MSRKFHLTIHLPGREEMDHTFHVNLDIFVWSQNSTAKSKKALSTITNHFPHRITIDIPEDLVLNLVDHGKMPDAVDHCIRIKAIGFHHPSGDLIATTYHYTVIKEITFAEKERIYIQSKEQISIYVKFSVLFKTKKPKSIVSLIILRDRTIGISLIIHVQRLKYHIKDEYKCHFRS